MGKFKIKGKVVYQNIGIGFWGIEDENKEKWMPVNMPDNLKKEGLEVELTAEEAREEVSVFMWGKPVNII
ncbi:MAG: hypothetical protein GY795_47530 [Desulfobacterales bacterium]|nr:hypothetical protein [Desulfobacterales bacterium]